MLVASITGALKLISILADAGRSVDLTGLDKWLGLLRAQILELGSEDVSQLKLDVATLSDEIESVLAMYAEAASDDMTLRIRSCVTAILDDVGSERSRPGAVQRAMDRQSYQDQPGRMVGDPRRSLH